MNILYLTPVMKIGGEELSTLSLTKEMVKRGHNVFVMGSKGPMYEEFVSAGARVITTTRSYRRNVAGILSDARNISDIVHREHIDIVHSQSVFPTLSAWWALHRMSRKPDLIFHERGISPRSYPIVSRIFNHLVDCVLTNSDHEVALLRKNGLKIPCTRIHNCINISVLQPDGDDIRVELGINQSTKIIGIVGRITWEKGHECLLEAFSKVLESRDCTVVLLIVGDGNMRERIAAKAVELKVEDNVIFTGFRRDLENIYPALDMLIVPSVFETFGNVAVEAGAYGVPVIASSVGGLPEALMHGESGIVVPPRDPQKLAEAIIYLLEHPEAVQRLGERGRELSTTYFTPARVADEVENIYKTLTSS